MGVSPSKIHTKQCLLNAHKAGWELIQMARINKFDRANEVERRVSCVVEALGILPQPITEELLEEFDFNERINGIYTCHCRVVEYRGSLKGSAGFRYST